MFFIHKPGDKRAKVISGFATSHMDILPTILDIYRSYGVEYRDEGWLKGKGLFENEFTKERKTFSANANSILSEHFATHEIDKVCFMAYDVLNPECQEIIEEGLEEFYGLASNN
jgi:hypothetical protein